MWGSSLIEGVDMKPGTFLATRPSRDGSQVVESGRFPAKRYVRFDGGQSTALPAVVIHPGISQAVKTDFAVSFVSATRSI